MGKILKFVFIAVWCMCVGYGIYTNQKSTAISDLTLANVEALADGTESSGGYGNVYYPQPGDPNYGYTKCACWGSGSLSCC